MKILRWLAGFVIAVPVLMFGTIYGVSEMGGEVVILHRTEATGETSTVRIWIVDEAGDAWIEHGAADAHWISLLAQPGPLTLVRGDQLTTYTAVADPSAHERYHELRRAKYGWADRVVEFFSNTAADCTSVPVRLDLPPMEG